MPRLVSDFRRLQKNGIVSLFRICNKHQMTSTKYQINFNDRNSKPFLKRFKDFFRNCFGHSNLLFGIYLGFGIWDL
jgi:uncharacterized membrane protein YesL